MSKGAKNKVDINKNPEEKKEYRRKDPNQLWLQLDDDQRIYLEKMANILSKIRVTQPDGSIKSLIPDKTLTAFGKSALSFMANIYLNEVLVKSEIAANLTDKEALNEFVSFRKKYMNFPVDKQIVDLKRIGIVK